MAVTQEIGPSQRGGVYHLLENELAVGSTLGGPKVACIIKATGALQTVYSVDFGQSLFGAVVVRHYDEDAGVYLAQNKLGTFTLHPEHQEHHFPLPLNISVHETIFVLNTKAQEDATLDPPGVYFAVEMCNNSAEAVRIATYASASLRGGTGHDVVTEFNADSEALVSWNASEPDWVRCFGCSDPPESYETTLDHGRGVSTTEPGSLSGRTDAPDDPLGVLRHVREIEPGATARFYYLLSFGHGREEALRNYRACPPADEGLAGTRANYSRELNRAVLMTPNTQVNLGVLWAKANMMRTMIKAPTGWCFVNDPTRTNNSVRRDTFWFANGCDYLSRNFARNSLLAYVRNQEASGQVVEYYDVRNGKTADYDMNVNDNTPLLVLALWHHYNTTSDLGFLQETYSAAVRAVRHLLSQRSDQGLIWCTATGTSDWGIAGWRNVITDYRLSGASTEINSECYAALVTASQMAQVLGRLEEHTEFIREADHLKTAINTHLKNPANGLYYLNIDLNGDPHSDVTSDLVFPVLFGVADEQTSAAIISRLSGADFWTVAGIRTTPHDAQSYDPDGKNDGPYGLMGGVWLGCSFWFAFAAAPYTTQFMSHALSASFRTFSIDPGRYNTVPGQFSEWLHGETLTNAGMMLSPWDPPRYLWAAIEGVAGLTPDDTGITLRPRLANDWKWLALQNVCVRDKTLTYVAVRMPSSGAGDMMLYANFHPQCGRVSGVRGRRQ